MNRTDYFLAGLVIISGIVSAGCSAGATALTETSGAAEQPDQAATMSRPATVEAFTVRTDATAGARLIPAVVSVEGTAVVLARRDGLLTWLGGEEGAPVVRDQILARLDDDEARAQLRQAELDASRMSVDERQYEALVEVNRSDLERQQLLLKDGLISQSALDQVKYKFQVSEEQLKAARMATLIGRSKVQTAQVEIDRAQIRAPIAGIVVRRHARFGANLLRGDKLFEISKLGPLEVRFQISEAEKASINVGTLLDLSLTDGRHSEAHARIRRVDPVVDAASNSLGYVADVLGGEKLIPGQAVYVRLTRTDSAASLRVPRAAFSTESNPAQGQVATLWVITGGTCASRTVVVGVVDGDQVSISAGLKLNDRVIVAPPAELREGDLVEVTSQSRSL